MPVDKQEMPAALRPYLFHGVDLSWKGGDEDAVGDCPWCGKEKHFAVGLASGLWNCRVCGEGSLKGGGNIYTFLRTMHKHCRAVPGDYDCLCTDRRLLHTDTLRQWGVVWSPFIREWLVPGYNTKGLLCQLYRYATKGNGHRVLLATPTVGHHLFAADMLQQAARPTIYVCEGPWDGMVLWELLQCAKLTDQGPRQTANPARSLAATAGVLAVPGCSTFLDKWLPLFNGKHVCLAYDSDHPRTNPKTGRVSAAAGWAGMRRAVGLLHEVAASVKYLQWGPEGYDPARPSGFDLRDMLSC